MVALTNVNVFQIYFYAKQNYTFHPHTQLKYQVPGNKVAFFAPMVTNFSFVFNVVKERGFLYAQYYGYCTLQLHAMALLCLLNCKERL